MLSQKNEKNKKRKNKSRKNQPKYLTSPFWCSIFVEL